MSTTTAPQAGASAAPPAGEPAPAGEDRPVAGPAFWLGVALATLLAWAVLTWPLTLHLDHFWTMKGNVESSAEPNFVSRPGTVTSGDFMQTVFIQTVVVDNVRDLRNPYLDLREGAAGLTELRTTSLDLPWTPLFALLWPVMGMVPAYNLILLLATVATGLAAFGWLRRHVRGPLLAAAGALAYTFTPNRMFQLTVHFNAVLWWSFPAALWAFEVMVERHRAGRRWRGPAAGVVAVALTIALSGEFHLTLYMSALLTFMAVWALVAARMERRLVPLAPAAVTLAAVAAGAAYAVLVFRYAFKGTVSGENGSFQQVLLYAPDSLWALAQKTFGTQGEELIYVGWPLLLLAVAGLAAVVAGRLGRAGLGEGTAGLGQGTAMLGRGTARLGQGVARLSQGVASPGQGTAELGQGVARLSQGVAGRQVRAALPYAVLVVPLVFLTYGPRSDIGPLQPYRLLFDNVSFVSLQRVPERLMCLTALVLVLLAIVTLDLAILRWPGWVGAGRTDGAGGRADGAGEGPAGSGTGEPAGRDQLPQELAGRELAAGEPATGDPAGRDQPARELDERELAASEDPALAAEVGMPEWIAEAQAAAEADAEAGRARTGAGLPPLPDWLRTWLTPGRVEAGRLAAAALVLATLLLLADYRVSENRLQPDLAGNKVVAALRSAGDQAGPVLGLPALKPHVTWNSASTYLAAQSRRRVLNAYNQTPARWLDDRMKRLEPLNRGVADPAALEVLRTTGTHQVLVIDEPRVFAAGEWEQTLGGLIRSGRFRLAERDGPLALLELVGGQSPTRSSEQPGTGSDPTKEL